jgi:hypothetical protein
MFKIGDTVWFARAGQHETQITCPDCAGTRRIRLILANDEQVSIDCGGCSRGYEGPCGTITEYKFKAEVESFVVGGMEVKTEGVRYYTDTSSGAYYVHEDKDCFVNKEDAVERCKQLIKEAVDRERDRLLKKERDTRSWAWNASYHRRCIKDAQKQLDYHTAKLNVAQAKAKEVPTP